ncbi:hypothetical protein FB480_101514 [Agrobacterium vitis]|nr:hypothetical protein FB480_101514 [Agrobacterium vitis]
MTSLTLCLPSNRPLTSAATSIDSAVQFCQQRNCYLVIADNSGDPAKRAYYEQISDRVIYIQSQEKTAIANLLVAVSAANTPFVMPIGDDDFISSSVGSMPIDLTGLSNDFAGVVPLVELRGEDGRVLKTKGCGFESDDPAERLKLYLENAKGDNTGYYSLYRRQPFLQAISFIAAYHPTRGSYTDWAVALALLASGKMLHDPSILYSYTLGRWADPAAAQQALIDLYVGAGLPPSAARWDRLFVYLDLYVLVSSAVVDLPQDEKQALLARLSSGLLLDFISRVSAAPQGLDNECLYLCEMIAEESDSFMRFQMALLLIDRVQAGLKDRYITFFRQAISMS